MALAALGKLNLEEAPPIWGSRSVDCFEKIKLISHGTYGEVYMAKEIETGEIVALKKIRTNDEREGFPVTAIREIKILKKLHHRNVINLKEVVYSSCPDKDDQRDDNNKYKGEIYMVFEYMDHDLAGLAYRPGTRFTAPQIKCCMKQLLTGLHYCHVKHVLHRDIKGSNLLIDKKGNLKLADFTLARTLSLEFTGTLTNQVTTLWYRAPELLLGATEYGPAVDMWSVACLFAELLNGEPIFPGKTEIDQLKKIYDLCGSPDENNWPGVSEMPLYKRFEPSLPLKRRLIETYGHFDAHALELLECMLVLDPPKRISAKDALDSDYFWSEPLPCEPKRLLASYKSSHELQTKKKRKSMPRKTASQVLNQPKLAGEVVVIGVESGGASSSLCWSFDLLKIVALVKFKWLKKSKLVNSPYNIAAGSNLLIDNEGNLKLADFGLAHILMIILEILQTVSSHCCIGTPPELLLGATKYGPAIDMWSVGCIFAQLLNGKPILPGKTERRVREMYRHFDRHALELLEKMLVLGPSQRICAKDAEYFWTDPLPYNVSCPFNSLPTYESSHEFQTKKMRQQMRHNEEAAKKQKLQQQGGGQSHAAPHWPSGPNHSMNNVVTYCHHNYPLVDLAATTTNQKQRGGGAPGPNRYPPSANQSGGYNYQSREGYSSGPYPPQGRGAPYGAGPSGGYGVGPPPNYSQGGGQYGGSGRGQNPTGGARNQQYGWQP
ncbi:hypothetical protein HID58_054865 [Brassica napus]|uniref:Protein kinase domain-containing protein n=2 Tax=Brassica napus TaxID=3708 RepID=A0ABQ8AIQ7_BRANA|nr:hypothetical protein HID58_054865 [Brassica napus]CDY14526.1 BnaC03g49330D [Brassica napus]